MSGNSESKPVSERGKVGKNSPSMRLSSRTSWNEGRFYGGDDEAYWRLSFGEERCEGQKIRGGLKSIWYDSDEEFNVPLSSSQCSDRRKVREFPKHVQILQGNDSCEGEPEFETRKEVEENSRRSVDKDEVEQRDNKNSTSLDSPGQRSSSFSNFVSNEIKEECVSKLPNLDEEKLKDRKVKEEEKLKYEKPRKSVYINKESPRRRAKKSSKTKVCSMRMATKIECKIRALENKKNAKSKIKKVAKEGTLKSTTAFDSFAVVKSSVNPEQDFIDSMVEMITAKGIQRPEELEELLACYLTLNHDEHHDLIIRVFRQVWFDLNQIPSDSELQYEHRRKL
ncbi:hypothetical protein LguiA_014813 [Lonicera macranthoides]